MFAYVFCAEIKFRIGDISLEFDPPGNRSKLFNKFITRLFSHFKFAVKKHVITGMITGDGEIAIRSDLGEERLSGRDDGPIEVHVDKGIAGDIQINIK